MSKCSKLGAQHLGAYNSWSSIKRRCLDAKNKRFEKYGGRRISLCEKWFKFNNFLADMGDRPEGMSIDRIDNNGHYEPGNCRWATNTQQQRNKSNNHCLTLNGRTQAAAAWAEELGLKKMTIIHRKRRGWSDKEALTAPLGVPVKAGRRLTESDAA